MKRSAWILGGVVAAAGLIGVQVLLGTSAGAQDGLPDIAGDFTGTIKGKSNDFELGTKPGSIKNTCAFSASLCGSSLSAELVPTGGSVSTLQGQHGGGHFWAFSGNSDEPLVMTGHVNKTATKFKAKVLAGHAEGTSDLAVSAVKSVE